MENKDITLTVKDQNKIKIVTFFTEGRLVLEEALRILGCSERTLYRYKAKLLQQGPAGFVHGNRGQVSPHKTAPKTVLEILKLKEERYHSTNDTHFQELLDEHEGILIGRSTLQRLLRGHGLKAKHKRRKGKYRSRRPRKEAFGMMLQLDASFHPWLGSLRPWLTLHGAIDDATGCVWAHFEDKETTYGYFCLMREVFLTQGLPLSLYTDRHSIFFPVLDKLSVEAQRLGLKPETQFGRAMRELGIEMIPAYSPQAKGRIERLWQTFQDRLAEEMRLFDILTKEQAQAFLKDFLKRYNQRYAVAAKSREAVFLNCPRRAVLDDILCHKEFRMVNLDHTVCYERRILQIPKGKGWRSLAKKTVEVWEHPDGSLKIAYQGQILQTYPPQSQEVLYQSAA